MNGTGVSTMAAKETPSVGRSLLLCVLLAAVLPGFLWFATNLVKAQPLAATAWVDVCRVSFALGVMVMAAQQLKARRWTASLLLIAIGAAVVLLAGFAAAPVFALAGVTP